MFLNPGNQAFCEIAEADFYVDKTMLLQFTNKRLKNPSLKYICVSRPRRFGKTVTSNMICAYYSKGCDSDVLFSQFKISSSDSYKKNLNKYNVLKVDINAMYAKWHAVISPNKKFSFVEYLTMSICEDMKETFPKIDYGKFESVSEYMQRIYAQTNETFVIVMDEYDVLVREGVSEAEYKDFLAFLNSLFKNSDLEPAISLAYLTGILPIMKDKIQSKLNVFDEITMLDASEFAEFTGFTHEDVRMICKKFNCSFDECKNWYDGYKLGQYEIYNPRAVVQSCLKKKFQSYWSGTSSYEVVSEKILMNFAGTKDAVVSMLSGGMVEVNVKKYNNTLAGIKSLDDVLTFLIHLGYLAYDENAGICFIPNREVHEEWINAIEDNDEYAEPNRIIKASKNLFYSTISGDEVAVAKALDVSHVHVSSNLSYNNEYSLQSAIYLAYIYLLNYYLIVKEMPSGKGVADISYIPFDKNKPALIVELKHNGSPFSALKQIKEKLYFDTFSNWNGEVIFVGINYDEKTKTHSCKIERFNKT